MKTCVSLILMRIGQVVLPAIFYACLGACLMLIAVKTEIQSLNLIGRTLAGWGLLSLVLDPFFYSLSIVVKFFRRPK